MSVESNIVTQVCVYVEKSCLLMLIMQITAYACILKLDLIVLALQVNYYSEELIVAFDFCRLQTMIATIWLREN